MGFELVWVARTPNTKTGDIPSCYVGKSLAECRASCQGCPLLDRGCYAWAGFARVSLGRIEKRAKTERDRYRLESALGRRDPKATAARIGAMGDPARADRTELLAAVEILKREELSVISYTHFWREPEADGLQSVCMASCEDVDQADQAIAKGFRPAVILPWDQVVEVGKTFKLPSGGLGVVCPAQTKPEVTCNTCRMCSLSHPVWEAGKLAAIGFLDHSRAGKREQARWASGRQLPMFGRDMRDVRTLPPATTPPLPTPGPQARDDKDCPRCGKKVFQPLRGRPRIWCGRACRLAAQAETRRASRR